jgi:hypothetical protein
MKLITKVLIFLTLIGCTSKNDESDIVGMWDRIGANDTLIFYKDGTIEGMPNTRYELISSILPKQIYLVGKDSNGESIRVPMGIYKITGDKLVLAYAKFYERALSGITLGDISKIEMPKDFSDSTEVYEYKRLKSEDFDWTNFKEK